MIATIVVCYLVVSTWALVVYVGIDMNGGTRDSSIQGWNRAAALSFVAIVWWLVIPLLMWRMASIVHRIDENKDWQREDT